MGTKIEIIMRLKTTRHKIIFDAASRFKTLLQYIT